MKIELDLPDDPTPHEIMAAVAFADPVEQARFEGGDFAFILDGA